MKDIRLNLNVNEINLVLKSLGNLPYYQVCSLIEKIQAQANLQITHANGNGQSDTDHKTETTIHHS